MFWVEGLARQWNRHSEISTGSSLKGLGVEGLGICTTAPGRRPA